MSPPTITRTLLLLVARGVPLVVTLVVVPVALPDSPPPLVLPVVSRRVPSLVCQAQNRLQLSNVPSGSVCRCGTSLDDYPTHLISHLKSCSQASGIRTHNAVVQALSHSLQSCNVICTPEPRMPLVRDPIDPNRTSRLRPDLLIHLGGIPYAIDVTVINPSVESCHTELTEFHANREACKKTKYRYACHVAWRCRFVPFTVDIYGGLGPTALSFLKELNNHLTSVSDPDPSAHVRRLLANVVGSLSTYNGLRWDRTASMVPLYA